MRALSPRTLTRIGALGLVTGLLGVASAALMLLWPAQTAGDTLSHPFTTEGFRAIQTWFFVHHLGLVALLVGLARSGAVPAGRLPMGGAWLAVVGTAMLAAMELYAIRFAAWTTVAANEGAMGAGYGISTTIIGLGMLGAGIVDGLVRRAGWALVVETRRGGAAPRP